MTAARGFARYLAGIDAGTEVPPLGLMPHRQRWRQPFIYSPADIDAVMSQARCSIASPLRAATYQTLIGLLAVSGLRIGEAIKLDRADVDWAEGVLLIRESKFGKSRLVPLHTSTMEALAEHAGLRDDTAAATEGAELLRVPDPQPAQLRRRLLRPSDSSSTTPASEPDAPSAPRLHDLRHTFRGPHPAGVVSQRRGRPGQDSRRCRPTWAIANRRPPTGISRPPRSCSRWPPPARTPRGRRPGHDPDRADAAGLLHRPARPAAPGQPTHHRGLPRRPATAARRSCTTRPGRRPPSSTGTTWTPR